MEVPSPLALSTDTVTTLTLRGFVRTKTKSLTGRFATRTVTGVSVLHGQV